MKKLLAILGSAGLISTSPILATAMAPANTHLVQAETIASVTNEDGYWAAETGGVNPTNGHETVQNQWDISLSKFAPSFEVIKENFKYLTLGGIFDFGTYKEPVVLNTIKLVEGNNTFSSDSEIVFNYYRENKASNGWGHQQSSITMVVKIQKLADGQAAISLDSKAEAASQASVHQCHTSIDVNTISIIA